MRAAIEEAENLSKQKMDLQDQVDARLKENDTSSKGIEEQVEKFRIAKDDVQKLQQKIEQLNYKLSEKEHEDAVMKHSLQGMKD